MTEDKQQTLVGLCSEMASLLTVVLSDRRFCENYYSRAIDLEWKLSELRYKKQAKKERVGKGRKGVKRS